MMFNHKPKTRVNAAREKVVKFRKQADNTRRDVVHQLNRSARHLRSDVEYLLEGDERAARLAKELEHMAHDIEKRAEQRIDNVSKKAKGNVWSSIAIAFGIGLLVGLLLKVMKR